MEEKILTYRTLESRFDNLLKQREMLTSKLVEIQNTLAGMDEIEKSKEEILFPIGAEAYVPGKVADKKRVIVEVGAGVVMEKTVEEVKEILNRRKEDLVGLLQNIQQDIITISSHLEQLGADMQKLSEETSEKEAG